MIGRWHEGAAGGAALVGELLETQISREHQTKPATGPASASVTHSAAAASAGKPLGGTQRHRAQ